MNSQKIENLLNLSLSATIREREKSLNLETGFSPETKTWEVIVKYHGDLVGASSEVIQIEPLLPGYAIAIVPEPLLEAFAGLEEVEFVEKPKRLFFQTTDIEVVKNAACILPVTIRAPFLTGEGVLVAVIDSGIDYFNPAFRAEDGSTRIVRLWDQSLSPDEERNWRPPEGFQMGVEFRSEEIDLVLQGEAGREEVPSVDISGHGTAVAAIAAGSPIERNDGSQEGFAGIAPGSELLVVKMGGQQPDGFPRTTEMMRALTYVVRTAIELQKPVAVNISFGNTYGDHLGNSLLERFLDNITGVGKNVVIVGSGNEGASNGHTSGHFLQREMVEFVVGEYERTLNIQIWKAYLDNFRITIISPGGSQITIENTQTAGSDVGSGRIRRETMEGTELLLFIGEPLPYSTSQEIYIDMIPEQVYITAGIWQIVFEPLQVVTGNVALYMPSAAARSAETFFFLPTPDMTLTIPSTAQKVITVGAYDTQYQSYADFSGRGYVLMPNQSAGVSQEITPVQVKPEVAAPGVEIETVAVGGGTEYVTGTSFATPVVTGSAALMMEWGIVAGNDPYLYGAKVKAYFMKGARKLPGFSIYPDSLIGWGALCVRDSLPV